MNVMFQESTSSYYDWCTPGDSVLRANEHLLFHRHVKSRIISISCRSLSKFFFVVVHIPFKASRKNMFVCCLPTQTLVCKAGKHLCFTILKTMKIGKQKIIQKGVSW